MESKSVFKTVLEALEESDASSVLDAIGEWLRQLPDGIRAGVINDLGGIVGGAKREILEELARSIELKDPEMVTEVNGDTVIAYHRNGEEPSVKYWFDGWILRKA